MKNLERRESLVNFAWTVLIVGGTLGTIVGVDRVVRFVFGL